MKFISGTYGRSLPFLRITELATGDKRPTLQMLFLTAGHNLATLTFRAVRLSDGQPFELDGVVDYAVNEAFMAVPKQLIDSYTWEKPELTE